jgi:hypothetical protein
MEINNSLIPIERNNILSSIEVLQHNNSLLVHNILLSLLLHVFPTAFSFSWTFLHVLYFQVYLVIRAPLNNSCKHSDNHIRTKNDTIINTIKRFHRMILPCKNKSSPDMEYLDLVGAIVEYLDKSIDLDPALIKRTKRIYVQLLLK